MKQLILTGELYLYLIYGILIVLSLLVIISVYISNKRNKDIKVHKYNHEIAISAMRENELLNLLLKDNLSKKEIKESLDRLKLLNSKLYNDIKSKYVDE
jgi:uncharacterized membrane protein YcgQ (UPF0703/DUF1980 family)